MTSRQAALLTYHRDLAFFATVPKTPVFVILDLDDPVAMEIASHFESNCAKMRDAIKAGGACPAYALALTVNDANTLLGQGWPSARKIGKIPVGMIPVILVSEGRCLVVLIRR